ncbi:MAG: hypothetical protein ACHQAZ_08390 [Gammaproteobacteria bacterium]
MQQRSKLVTVVGSIFVILSALGLLQCLLLMFTPSDKLLEQTQLTAGNPQLDPALMASVLHGVFVFMFVLLLWVLLSSVGLVMRKPWARTSMIVLLGVGIAWNLLYVLMGVTGGPAGMGAMMQGMGKVLAVMGLVFIGLFGWALYLLTRPKIKAEFLPTPKT